MVGINYDASDEDGDDKDGEIGIGKEGRRIGEAASLLGRHWQSWEIWWDFVKYENKIDLQECEDVLMQSIILI